MSKIRVAILGFGTVGQGIYRILNERKMDIKSATGFEIDIVSILVRDVLLGMAETQSTRC